MVLVAFVIAGMSLAVLLYDSLLRGVDDAAAGRVRDVVAALQYDTVAELDGSLLITDQRIVAVQIIDDAGNVVQRSDSAPTVALVSPGTIGPTLVIGLRDHGPFDGDMRISGQTADGLSGRYTILVGAGSEAIESTVKTVRSCSRERRRSSWRCRPRSPIYWWRAHFDRSTRSGRGSPTSARPILPSAFRFRPTTTRYPRSRVTMNEMLARIEAGHDAQRRFVGDASHELRSPVAAILSALDVAAAHPEFLNEELATSTLRPEAQRMESLVEDLLLLARVDERGLAFQRRDVDLDDVASNEMGRLLRETTLTVDADLAPTRLIGDPGGLSRALRNLLENAARHATSGSNSGSGRTDPARC